MNIVNELVARISDSYEERSSPYFVAICGWADTGKSTLAAQLCDELNFKEIDADWISTDAFLKNRAERNRLGISGYNPQSVDATEISHAVGRLIKQETYNYHPYDNRTGSKISSSRTIFPKSIVIIEGIHAFHEALWKHCHLRVFIESDEETLRVMRKRANMEKRAMNECDASTLIDRELQEYRKYLLPNKVLANISMTVSSNFDYSIQIIHKVEPTNI